MGKVLNNAPVSRIEGHAKIAIHLDDNGNVEETFLHIQSLRGFEKFIEGIQTQLLPGRSPMIALPAAFSLLDIAKQGIHFTNR